jgi:hypothetical protein
MEIETAFLANPPAPAQPSRERTVSSHSLTLDPCIKLRGSLPDYCEAGFLRGLEVHCHIANRQISTRHANEMQVALRMEGGTER